MALRLEFQMPDAERFRLGFTRLGEGVEDLQPFLRDVVGVLERWEARVFDTEGAAAGKPWAHLSPVTVHIRKLEGFPAGPILEKTGRLRAALTQSGTPYSLRAVSSTGLVFGTRGLSYAPHHQFGTRQRGVTPKQQRFMAAAYGIPMALGHVIKMPARPVLTLGEGNHGIADELRRDLIAAGRQHVLQATRRAFPGGVKDWEREIERDFDARVERNG